MKVLWRPFGRRKTEDGLMMLNQTSKTLSLVACAMLWLRHPSQLTWQSSGITGVQSWWGKFEVAKQGIM